MASKFRGSQNELNEFNLASSDEADAAMTLDVIVRKIEAAYGAEDFVRAAELLDTHLITAWFGMNPHRFGEVLSRTLANVVDPPLRLQVMHTVVFESSRAVADERVPVMETVTAPLSEGWNGDDIPEGTDDSLEYMLAIGRQFSLRLAGRVKEAAVIAKMAKVNTERLRPLIQWNQAWSLFTAVQYGLTLMLAGEFQAALVAYTHARMHGQLPTVSFLSRDACVKAAVLEALYGDMARAEGLLEEAEKIPRSSSWVEVEIDALFAVGVAMVRAESDEEALAQIEAVPLRDVGESWPLYLAALQRKLHALGRIAESTRRNLLFDSLPMPAVEGEGYSGSVRNLTATLTALARGDLAEARHRIDRADQSILVTQIVLAQVELVSGRAKESLQLALDAREEAQHLRILEIWRLGIVASSYWALGDEEACAAVLRQTIASHQRLNAAEVKLFSQEVRKFAGERFEGWPAEDATFQTARELFGQVGMALTSREITSLQLLARGYSREQIAREQFISVNTLKGHLQSLYRKLDVSSRAAAVAEGELRGLL